jgi:CO/xanthine dehydrogenase FAD-binding subunit
MGEMSWYFPESLDEARGLLDRGRVHGGGTQILRTNMSRIRGLIDLGRLDLKYLRNSGGVVRIGAAQTYTGIVRSMSTIDAGHILVKALKTSSSESLRSRITAGGSVAAFPVWSDIMGPLLALEASVTLIGKNEGEYEMAEFIQNRTLMERSLITELSFDPGNWISSYHRETRVAFDHALFTVTVLLGTIKDRIDDCRIVVVGTKGRFTRLGALEKTLIDEPVEKMSTADLEERMRKLKIDFPSRRSLPPEYIGHLARVAIERGLEQVLRR